MAQLPQAFSAAELPQSDRNYDPIPEGWYDVEIKGAELRTTKAGTGQYIAVRYDVTGPTHGGRVIYGNLNVSNPNPKAEEIGRQQMGELMRSIGLPVLQDTDQLVGGRLSIKVSIRKSEQYGDSNDVKGFKALAGGAAPSAPAPQAAAPQPAAAPAPAAATAPPWAQRA
ncbi:MAG TPA: DUF669 domain-containing protein [Acidimicrobiia bacterium]